MASFSFSPQFATIRSESPLAGMRPVTPTFTALTFAQQRPLEIKSAKPELVTEGIVSGVKEGVGSALKGITAAYVGERETKAKLAEEARKFKHEKDIANIREEKTEDEVAYDKLRLQNLESLIEERGGNKVPKNIVPRGTLSQPEPSNIIEVPLPTREEEKLPIDFETPLFGDVTSTSLQDMEIPEMQTLLAIDSLHGISDVGGKDVMTQRTMEGAMTPATPQLTDFTAQAEEIRRQQIDEAIKKDELAQGQFLEDSIPVRRATAVETPQFSASQLLGMTFSSFEDAKKANEMLSAMYPDYNIKPIEQTEYEGNTYYELQTPEKKSAKEIDDEQKIKKELELSAKAPELSKDQTATALSIIGKLESDKTYFKSMEARDSRDTILISLSKEDGFSDIAAINAFQRLIDPGVAVREGDVALIQSASALFDKLNSETLKNRLEKGGKLTAEDREKMRVLTKELARMAMEKANKGPIPRYRQIAEKAGFDPDLIVIPHEFPESESETLIKSARSLVDQIKSLEEGDEKESLKAQLREIQIKLTK